jgi:hypothetical protein
MPYSDWDILVREIGGGIWFWTSLWLDVAFIGYMLREFAREGRLADRVAVIVAFWLVVYFTGSMIRGFLTWGQFMALGNGREGDATVWVATWPWFGTSVIFNITGAMGCIWMLSSWRWRVIFSVCALMVSIGVPIIVRLIA